MMTQPDPIAEAYEQQMRLFGSMMGGLYKDIEYVSKNYFNCLNRHIFIAMIVPVDFAFIGRT
jgi:hypothetical protein